MNRSLLIALLLVPGISASQETSARSTPVRSVAAFKVVLDEGNVAGMCEYLAAPDSTGPLARADFERMQTSMEGLITLWRGHSFSYEQSIVDPRNPQKANVRIRIPSLKQNASFELRLFANRWYILDISITFH